MLLHKTTACTIRRNNCK